MCIYIKDIKEYMKKVNIMLLILYLIHTSSQVSEDERAKNTLMGTSSYSDAIAAPVMIFVKSFTL